jgi:hypothetical protein
LANPRVSGLLSIEELQALLRPHLARLGRTVWPIWARYLELPEEHRLAFDATTEANMLHCYMVEAAKQEFDHVPGVQFLEMFGFHLGIDGSAFGVNGLAVCRFKKFDDEGKSRNYPTERAEALRRNEQLEGMPDRATYVDIGYAFNALRTAISEVQAIRVVDTKVVLSVPRAEGQTSQMPGILPFGPTLTPRRFTVLPGRRLKRPDGTDGM